MKLYRTLIPALPLLVMTAGASSVSTAASANPARAAEPVVSSGSAARVHWGKPIFTDNFTGARLNTTNWSIYNDPRADGKNHPRRTTASVKVRGGSLELIGHHQKPYGNVSGGIAYNADQTYGRWVVRFRADAGAGYAPVVLLWPQSDWPTNGEIDMAEITNSQRHGAGENLHLGKANNHIHHQIKASVNFTRWHTLAVDWLPGRVTFWLDGKRQWTHKPRSGGNSYIPSTPFHLALQNDQGCEDGCTTNKHTPKRVIMRVDWVKIYAAPRSQPATVLRDPRSKGVRGAAYSTDGKHLATADGNGRTYVWNLPGYKKHTTLKDPSSRGAAAVAYSPDSTALAIGDGNGRVYLSHSTGFRRLTGTASKGITSVAFTTRSHYVAGADANGHTYIWTVATGKILTTLTDPGSKGVRAATYSPDGNMLATADGNGRILIWALPNYKLQAILTDPATRGITTLAFSPHSTTITAGDRNGHTYVYRLRT